MMPPAVAPSLQVTEEAAHTKKLQAGTEHGHEVGSVLQDSF